MAHSLYKISSIREQVELDLHGYAIPHRSSPDPPSSPTLPPHYPEPSTPTPRSRRFWDVVMNPVDDATTDDNVDKACNSHGPYEIKNEKGKEKAIEIPDEDDLSDMELLYPATPPPVSSPPPSSPAATYYSPPSSPLPQPSPIKAVRPPDSASSTASSATLVSVASSSSSISHRSPKPGPGRPSTLDTFVCNLDGCGRTLSREYWAVRAHILYNPRHLGRANKILDQFVCPLEGCNFRSPSANRVAEHICSQAHLSIPMYCDAILCRKEYSSGRSWSLSRHRKNVCKFCLACKTGFKDAATRKRHEANCPDVKNVIAENRNKRALLDSEEGGPTRKKRRLSAPATVPRRR